MLVAEVIRHFSRIVLQHAELSGIYLVVVNVSILVLMDLNCEREYFFQSTSRLLSSRSFGELSGEN